MRIVAGLDTPTVGRILLDGIPVIGPGADVYSRDGEKVGEVETVEFDTETGRPTRVVVRKGWLFTEDLELPAGTIASADDGILTLNVDKERVEAWRNDNTVALY